MADGALALFSFEDSMAHPGPSPFDRAQWMADAARRRQVEDELATESGLDQLSPESWPYLHLQTDILLHRERWSAGHLPASYEHRLPFIHARSFLLTMDRLKRLLDALARMPARPPGVVKAVERFDALVPDLKGVRDTVAHIDERSRGLAWGKKLDLKPVDNALIHAPHGGATVLESLNGNLFGSTMADGHYGQVEVSPRVLLGANQLVQLLLEQFEWKGPPRHTPS